jgi:hypothetical protein
VQGSRYGGQFAINLGLHHIAIPTVIGEVADPKTITEPDCEFRRRLSEDGSDQWWVHDETQESMDFAMSEAAGVYIKVGRPMLSVLAADDSPIFSFHPNQMPEFRQCLKGFGSTDARIALVLARINIVLGREEVAHRFAEYGLSHAGKALSLKAQLEEIIESKT